MTGWVTNILRKFKGKRREDVDGKEEQSKLCWIPEPEKSSTPPVKTEPGSLGTAADVEKVEEPSKPAKKN